MEILDILRLGPVIPVVVVDRPADAVPLARALLAGGVRVLEVTLRTPAALDAVHAIAAEVEGVVVGVGTVARTGELDLARRAGARFAVSPGFGTALAAAARDAALPWLPGVMTPSEVMAAREAGCTALKFFPAEPAGGVAMLKALRGPFAEVVFCPTGGVTAATAIDYLRQPNVACVGGSWLTPPGAVAAGDWARITALAREAAALAHALG